MGPFSRAARGLRHMWNAFASDDTKVTPVGAGSYGVSYGAMSRPHAVKVKVSNERSLISSIYVRLAVDVAAAQIRHVRLDENQQYQSDMTSSLNDCLAVSPNIDQTPQELLVDYALTLFDKGVAALVPVETTVDPAAMGSWDVGSMRIGEVVAWFPRTVRVRVYDDRPGKGLQREITLPKSQVMIVENPFYTIMNEPNSVLQRLIHKLNLLDSVDEVSASGKLDMIIQLPYVIKSEARRQQADQRRKDIEYQLRGSEYGIAYTDGTEKITQLNRPATNNLMEQITYLRTVLLDQLGVTPEILNGSADEKTMLNYNSRTIKPILDAFKQEMLRKFLTKTARTQGQSIMYFKNPFELMPLSQMAEVADVLSRNEIAAPNELRTAIGMKPHPDPAANKLANSNMPQGTTPGTQQLAPPTDTSGTPPNPSGDGSDAIAQAALDQVDQAITAAFTEFGISGTPDAEVG